jgi:hypothetical protein
MFATAAVASALGASAALLGSFSRHPEDRPIDLGAGVVSGLSPAICAGRVQWENDSREVKSIASAVADCGCLRLSVSEDEVPPGGSFTVFAELAVSTVEEKSVGASILYSDGSVKRLVFRGSGLAGSRAVMIPRQAMFQTDAITTTRFLLPVAKADSVPTLSASSDHENLRARVARIRQLTTIGSPDQTLVLGEIGLEVLGECPLPCTVSLFADGAEVGNFIALPR